MLFDVIKNINIQNVLLVVNYKCKSKNKRESILKRQIISTCKATFVFEKRNNSS